MYVFSSVIFALLSTVYFFTSLVVSCIKNSMLHNSMTSMVVINKPARMSCTSNKLW